MSDRQVADDVFDDRMRDFFQDRGRLPTPDGLLEATLLRTGRIRPIPGWALPERWLVGDAVTWRRRRPGLLLVAAVIALSLLLAAAAILGVGGPRVPPPFGLAAPGLVSYIAGGDVWLAGPDGSAPRQLTTDPRVELGPVWSRDGTWIVFKRLPVSGSDPDWTAFGDIYALELATGTVNLVEAATHSPSPFSWAPDSRAIVYSRDTRTAEQADDPDGAHDQVFIGHVDGSPPRQLTDDAVPSWGPLWGPGDLIASIRGYPTIDGIWVMRPDGRSPRKLTRGVIESFDQMDWSVDGTTIVYSMYAAAVGGDRSIWSVGLDGQGERRLVSGWTPAVSPDGRRIAFIRGGAGAGQTRIHVANIDGSDVLEVSVDGSWSAPQWSPDGTRIVVSNDPAGRPPTITILDPAGVAPPVTFEVPAIEGLGRSDIPSWQRTAS